MAISFFRLGKFSSMILLKTFSGPLTWEFSFSSIQIILRFGPFIVSSISWMPQADLTFQAGSLLHSTGMASDLTGMGLEQYSKLVSLWGT